MSDIDNKLISFANLAQFKTQYDNTYLKHEDIADVSLVLDLFNTENKNNQESKTEGN